VDRDPRAVRSLEALAARPRSGDAAITALRGDLAAPPPLPPLDGVVVANALHFVAAGEQGAAVAAVARLLRPGAPLVLVEYDGRTPSRWVPAPVPPARFAALAAAAGLAAPTALATRPSAYGGTIYAAAARR